MIKEILNVLMKLNKKAIKNGDIPVSCVIVKNNKIIAKAYNKKWKNSNPFDHAEIIAIKKASKKLKTSNLIECDMYVTLKPCEMCHSVIKESKIRNVYYILNNYKINNNKINYQRINNEIDYFENELKDFFKGKR